MVFQHRTHGLSKLTALASEDRIAIPSRKSLIEEACDIGEDLVPDSDDTADCTPSYPLLYERGLELMSEWSRVAYRSRKFNTTTTHLTTAFLSEHSSTDLLRHPYGQLFFDGLMKTGVKWGALPLKNHRQFIGTSAGTMVASIWVHVNHIRPHIFKDVIWALRDDLYNALKSAFSTEQDEFSGFWDGISCRPNNHDASLPPPTQREKVFAVPVRFALDTIAGHTQETASNTVAHIFKLISHPNMGGIETADGWVLTDRVFNLAYRLFAVWPSNLDFSFDDAH